MSKGVKAVPTQEQPTVATSSTAVSTSEEKADAAEEVKAQHASIFEITLILKPYFWPK